MSTVPALCHKSGSHPVCLEVWIDLRTLVPAAAELRLEPGVALIDGVRAARAVALGPVGPLPLVWPVPDATLRRPGAVLAALDELGAALPLPEAFSLLVAESTVAAAGPDLIDTLGRVRARGFGVALEADPAMPLPFGRAARGLYTQLVVAAGAASVAHATPRCALAERLLAARSAGLTLIARGIGAGVSARGLALAGFDRGIARAPRRVHIATATPRVSSMAFSFSSR